VQNFRYSSTVDRDRLRLADRVRFLFQGRAFKRRFAARAAQQGIVFASRQPLPRFQFAAGAAMLAAMLAVIGWLGGQVHEARIRNQAMAADLHALRQRGVDRPAPAPPQTGLPRIGLLQPVSPPPTQPPTRHESTQPASAGVPRGPSETEQVRAALDQTRADLERAQAGSRNLDEQLKHAREQVDSLRSEIAGSRIVESRLADQVRESALRLSAITPELLRLQAGHSEDSETIAGQRLRLRELGDRLNAETDTIDRERKLLVADLDIRELMGARSLHIVDVFDVDGKGKTQRPFGRVFYTEGKSLIFYAFDLKGGDTFQAWGQREARSESAQSLGIFYVDDKKQNRWVLKFEDPKVLAEINAVFVTVEPPGGSVKPNRQKMLYAYLNATANHP
jgi:hypothetical protein